MRRSFQINTIAPPESIPAIAPALFVRFQNRENRTIGPKVAPKPDHAKDMNSKMTLFLFDEITIQKIFIRISKILETCITCLSDAFFLTIPSKMFLETADAAIRR